MSVLLIVGLGGLAPRRALPLACVAGDIVGEDRVDADRALLRHLAGELLASLALGFGAGGNTVLADLRRQGVALLAAPLLRLGVVTGSVLLTGHLSSPLRAAAAGPCGWP